MNENKLIAITNDYPTDKYNLLVPVKTMQELSDMYKITVNQVQIDPDYNKSADVYVQTKGYKDSPDKLALTKLALSKLMTATGIVMVESKSIIPSTHKTAIEMARAIGKVVPYDTRDTAHEVTIKVPEPSGQFRTIVMSNEIIVEDLKAEYMEQKKYLKVWKDGKQVATTKADKEEAVEKQLTQFLSHKRAQCHYTVTGSMMENGEQIFLNSDVVLPTTALQASDFNLVCLGHIHRAQQVPNCGRPTFYSGPLNAISFNEEGQDKGFYIHEYCPELPYAKINSYFIKTPSREFLTLEMNELDIDYFTRTGTMVIEEGNEAKDKIVRVIYSCSDETNKQFNRKSLKRHCMLQERFT